MPILGKHHVCVFFEGEVEHKPSSWENLYFRELYEDIPLDFFYP